MTKCYSVCVVAAMLCAAAAHRPHPKFPPDPAAPLDRLKGEYRKVACSEGQRRARAAVIERARCGQPREVFVHLEPSAPHEEVSPGAVWVRRCVGLCEYEGAGECAPTATAVRHVPVRIYNAKSNKETCATFPVEEHVSCGCCAPPPARCAPPARKCPDQIQRRLCLRKRKQSMRWNRSKCACEPRRAPRPLPR